MKLLLDTHVAIWAVTESPALKPPLRALLVDPATEDIFVSAASIWEIGIKFALQRASAPPFSAQGAIDTFAAAGFDVLDIESPDIVAATMLPLLHPDPFDRMIVAQALTLGLHLITYDRQVAAYSDAIILG